MKFEITRTSGDENKPCEEAREEFVEHWQTRTCTEEYFNQKYGKWREKGKNHKIDKDGNITRQVEDQIAWTIEINSLDELISLYEKYGDIIITKSFCNENKLIEIYDSYRE